jgi:transcriptional regulator with XRE-family HTH domain
MARWKELPAGLADHERRLVVQLRRLKDHSGLSLAALAGRTGYSRSSWERYLNGKQPVPRQAVEELAQVCGVEPTRLVVLYEVAAQARGRTGETERPERTDRLEQPEQPEPPGQPDLPDGPDGFDGSDRSDGSEPGTPARRPVRMVPLPRVLAASVVTVVVAFAAGLLTAGAWKDDTTPVRTVADTGYLRGQTYRCDIQREDGALRAGHSTTREMLLDINSTGFDVVEAQCLLREQGFDPGATDGLYAEGTRDAAKRFQQERGLVVDGIVGPDTWRELRR